MGIAIDTIGGFLTNTTAITAATVSPGDSFTVRATIGDSMATLDNVWGKQATLGAARIRSPRMHDFVNGLRFSALGSAANAPRQVLPDEVENQLYSQDPLTVELTSGGADSSFIALQLYYSNLGGISANLMRFEEVDANVDQYLSVLVSPTGSATIGTWGPGRAINADVDQFKVNRWYAILGYITDTAVGCISVRGSDTGNLRIGGPGPVEPIETRDYFIGMAKGTGRPYIPVFNSANRASLLVDLASNTASPAPNITFLMALLKGNIGGLG